MNKYAIANDANNWTLQALSVAKTGKNAGQETVKVIGYYSSLPALLRALPDKMMLEYGIDRLEEALAEAKRLGESMATRVEEACRKLTDPS